MKMENLVIVRESQKGFTLLELLVTVAIIGLLVAIAIPQFKEYRKSAYDAGAKHMALDLTTAAHAMLTDMDSAEGESSYSFLKKGATIYDESSVNYNGKSITALVPEALNVNTYLHLIIEMNSFSYHSEINLYLADCRGSKYHRTFNILSKSGQVSNSRGVRSHYNPAVFNSYCNF